MGLSVAVKIVPNGRIRLPVSKGRRLSNIIYLPPLMTGSKEKNLHAHSSISHH